MLGRFGQLHGGGLGFLHRCGHLACRPVDGGHQFAQLVDGIIDRIGNGTGKVFGHRGGHGQVTVGQVGNFVEEPHDRILVSFVLFSRFTQLAVGFAHHHQADQDNRCQGQQAQNVATDNVQRATAGEVFKAIGQGRGFVEQGLRQAENGVRRFAHMEQLRRGFEDFVHGTGDKLKQFGNFLQAGAGILVFNLGNTQPFIAFKHAVEHLPETVGITPKGTCSLGGIFVAGQHRIDRSQNTLGQ